MPSSFPLIGCKRCLINAVTLPAPPRPSPVPHSGMCVPLSRVSGPCVWKTTRNISCYYNLTTSPPHIRTHATNPSTYLNKAKALRRQPTEKHVVIISIFSIRMEEKGKCVPKPRSISVERKELPISSQRAIRYIYCIFAHRQVQDHSKWWCNLVLCLSDYISDSRAAPSAHSA